MSQPHSAAVHASALWAIVNITEQQCIEGACAQSIARSAMQCMAQHLTVPDVHVAALTLFAATLGRGADVRAYVFENQGIQLLMQVRCLCVLWSVMQPFPSGRKAGSVCRDAVVQRSFSVHNGSVLQIVSICITTFKSVYPTCIPTLNCVSTCLTPSFCRVPSPARFRSQTQRSKHVEGMDIRILVGVGYLSLSDRWKVTDSIDSDSWLHIFACCSTCLPAADLFFFYFHNACEGHLASALHNRVWAQSSVPYSQQLHIPPLAGQNQGKEKACTAVCCCCCIG